jgi:peptidoglycan-associated lipoprotein
MNKISPRTALMLFLALTFISASSVIVSASDKEEKHKTEIDALQKEFSWWPTDAKPSPVKDQDRGGYWWWPTEPGQVGPLWGNRGYIYVHKIIFDYNADELPPAKPQELRPSLVIKKIIKNVKVYFDYNKSDIRDDAAEILTKAAATLKRNPNADILVTGNCDTRGSEIYNEKLGRHRAEAVKKFMMDAGINEERVRIISRGKLNAVAPVSDLIGMQKDRNAQFMIAEVEEIMIPAPGTAASTAPEDTKIVNEAQEEIQKNVESEVKVTTKDYTIKKNDSLWSIAASQMGGGHRWKYLYEMNKNRITNPNKLKVGTKIVIPIE